MATEYELGYSPEEQPAWSAAWQRPERLSPLDVPNADYVPPSVVRVRPTAPPVAPPPAEMRAYEPTTRERDVAAAQSALERLGMGRAGARRTAQTVLGGPSSNLPLSAGLIDIPLLPALPYFMEEGYRSTERAAGALGRGDYGTAALEYLGATAQMLPGALAARQAVPPVAKALKSTLGAMGESMGARAIDTPMAKSQRGVFLPEAFFTPREKAAISTAENLETKGATPEDVLTQTGLVRDLDGSWAVELSDDAMKFKALEAVKAARQPIVERMDNIQTAIQLRDVMDRGGTLGNAVRDFRSRTGADPADAALRLAQQRTIPQLESALENANNTLLRPIQGLKMVDVVEHPELFNRIPELAEMQVDFVLQKDLGKGAGGHFDPSGPGMGTIRMRTQYLRPGEDYGRSLTAHEVQHAIDYAAGKDYGISPETIKKASDYWKQQELPIRESYNVENTALYARELMEKNPGMTAEEALDKTLTDAWHYGESKNYAKPGKTINPENGEPYTQEGSLRELTIKIIDEVPSHELELRAKEAAKRLRENQLKRHIAEPTEAGREEQYMRNVGEARARLTQTRLDLTPEERRQIFPMQEQFMGLDRPREQLRTISELTGGLYGPRQVTGPLGPSLSSGMAGGQRGAVLFSMGGEQRPLREVLAEQPTTLRTLENLPQRAGVIPVQTIREQLRRPEVTKAERDVFERVLGRTEGESISAEQLVREVGLETKDFRLTPKDSVQYADYGLDRIDRNTGGSINDWTVINAQNARTTVHRSPTPTATNNHFGDPNYFGHTRAFEADGILHVVEIQSDLVQKAGREVSAAERTALEEANRSLDAQMPIVRNAMRSDAFRNSDFDGMATELEKLLSTIEPHNADARLLLGDYLARSSLFRGMEPEVALDYAILILRDDFGGTVRSDTANTLRNALDDFNVRLSVQRAENTGKLVERGTAEAQRPMFKNWERRLIREELSRAAAENKPVVRFADADTVALVEAWPRKLEPIAGEHMDTSLEGKRLVGSRAGTVNDWRYTGKVRSDDQGVIEAERFPIDMDGNRIGEPVWSVTGTQGLSERVLEKMYKITGFTDKGHQDIYDRYKNEITKYLKSLGGKHIKDDKGHGWWEVPIKPEQRRTQLFGVGGGAVAAGGAAAYNAESD